MMKKLLQFKPDSLPQWLFWLLLGLLACALSGVALLGLWVVFTQIDFM